MRVFLDSNVILSGIVFRGKPHDILRVAFDPKENSFIISEDVELEVREVLRRSFPRLRAQAEEILSILPVEVVPRVRYASRLPEFSGLRDPDDAHVLAAASVGRCDLVVTGDRDLLVVGQVDDMKIVRPAEALRLLTRPSG